MPITLTVSEGVLSAAAEAPLFTALADALLRVAGLEGNAFMTPNVIGTLNVVPKGRLFAGGVPADAAFVGLTLPPIALTTPEARQAFTEQAAAIIERASHGRVSRNRVWSNVVYAAEGSWGIAGRAYGSPELIEAIQGAVPA